jgi:hypothetical protein
MVYDEEHGIPPPDADLAEFKVLADDLHLTDSILDSSRTSGSC